MNVPAFVLALPVLRTAYPRSSVLGRPVAARFSVTQSRRAFLNAFACIPSDQSTGEETEPPAQETPATDPSTPPTAQPVAEAEPEPAAVQDSEDVVAKADTPTDGQSDEATVESSKAEAQKKRRRRSRKRDVTLPLEQLTVGMELEGTVKSVTDYGAFVGDMGTPTDGLLHVSQLAAGFVENVTDVVNVGDKLKVRVLNIDVAKGNFSLTRKTPEELEVDSQPRAGRRDSGRDAAAERRGQLNKRWDEFVFDPEVFVDAKVMSVTDFGGFCQLVDESGKSLESCPTDGLIHISELSQDRVAKVSDILKEGQVVKVRVTSTDRKRNRISMSLLPVGASGSQNESESSAVAADMANAEKNQPSFKSSFELAFESAKAGSQQ